MFVWKIRVYYEDTDAGGVVYHANYLKFLERARAEWLRRLGYGQGVAGDETALLFAVKSINVNYTKPARFNDMLEIRSKTVAVGRVSFVFEQEVFRKTELLATAAVKIACLSGRTFKPCLIPVDLSEAIQDG